MKRVFIDKLTNKDICDALGMFKYKVTRTGDVYDKNNPERTYMPVLHCMLVPSGFDIEAYKNHMYIWTFTINDTTIIGYTWSDFLNLLSRLKELLGLGRVHKTVHHRNGENEDKASAPYVMPIYIHNIKYEWAFMKSILLHNNVHAFFKDKKQRDPLYVIVDEAFLFIDSYKVYPMKLESVAKCYTKTQKSHDLDHTIPRTVEDAKKLTEKELTYCCNDTIILSELMQYTFDTYFKPYGRMPFSQNQIIKSIINTAYNISGDDEDVLKNINKISLSQSQYKFIRRDGFRGGFCQSSERYVIGDIGYGDLTSAYFTAIMHDYFPMGRYRTKSVKLEDDDFKYYTKKFCCQMLVKFYKLEAVGNKEIKYENKSYVTRYMPDGSDPKNEKDREIMRASMKVNESGRIYRAACISVSLTEIDWEIYKKVYTWEKAEILRFEVAKRGRLPEYIRKTALELYKTKATLKKAGRTHEAAYFTAKTLVSNVFGAIVQKLDKDIVEGEEAYWWAKTLDRKLKSQWGVYVTAHVRKMLLSAILEMGVENWLYSDTDSIYYIVNSKSIAVIEKHNSNMKLLNKAMCEEYGLDYELFDDLGCFDNDGMSITRFKTLGSKAYLLYYTSKDYPNGNVKLVLSGIPEKFFWTAYTEKYPTCNITEKEEELDKLFTFFEKTTEIVYERNEMVYVEDGCVIEPKKIEGTIGNVALRVARATFIANIDDRV